MDYFGYGIEDFICCELCGKRANDINHIECRGMGGSKNKDVIENLMAMCRLEHLEYGDKKQHIEMLKEKHKQFMEKHHA